MHSSTGKKRKIVHVSISCAGNDLEGLCQEFPQYDSALLEEMLQDQDGDVEEVQACLRVTFCFEISKKY